jgi:hypothetical protein
MFNKSNMEMTGRDGEYRGIPMEKFTKIRHKFIVTDVELTRVYILVCSWFV